MPETKTIFSRGRPILASTILSCDRIEKSAQPGHQRTSRSEEKSFGVNSGNVRVALCFRRLLRPRSQALPGNALPARLCLAVCPRAWTMFSTPVRHHFNQTWPTRVVASTGIAPVGRLVDITSFERIVVHVIQF